MRQIALHTESRGKKCFHSNSNSDGTLGINFCRYSGTAKVTHMKNNELHVVPTPEGWQISPPPEPDETFDTRTEAVLAAVQVAEIENLEVVIHADDGTIQEIIDTTDSNIAA
ncbi:MAG: hypothetical protein C0469_08265 [Cyanobacteria bacterium DS2.3.42]|nr:hypothetical protein [Cyanobacteria bacterium DS2.3.42]